MHYHKGAGKNALRVRNFGRVNGKTTHYCFGEEDEEKKAAKDLHFQRPDGTANRVLEHCTIFRLVNQIPPESSCYTGHGYGLESLSYVFTGVVNISQKILDACVHECGGCSFRYQESR